ncbi:hypothetical protein BDW74DRAFT_181121 [Aspergillus multicolor]|uniref:uncharacterized protein n=1 Tax=Aspergillus multicolor TaxID=41759 RepID=UPI003CCD301D
MTRSAIEPLDDDELSSLWRTACDDYADETGITIADKNFPKLSRPEELSHQLDAESDHFQNFRMKKRPLLHTVQTILTPNDNWGSLLEDVVAAAFPPASSIMGAMLLLIRSARKVSESFDMIIDLFQKLRNFVLRLDSYKGVPLGKGMRVVKDGLKPVSATSQILSDIKSSRVPDSGSWVDHRLQSWWKSPQPLLWLHGGPAVGKSYLAAKIINDHANTEISPTPVVASFFCKNNHVDLRSLNKVLRTLAWQIATELPTFAMHAEDFCLKEDPADTYAVWGKLLLSYFAKAESGTSVCFVIDGIDEAYEAEQEILFNLLEMSYAVKDQNKRLPHLRFVLLSRDSVRVNLEEHLLGLFRSSPELLEEVVSDIRESAEGLWEWANLVIESVLRCRTKGRIRQVVKTMPRGISAMLTKELQRLAQALSAADMPLEELSDETFEESNGEAMVTQIQQLNLILSFVTVVQKPLTVVQLEIMLEILFEDEVLNLEEDIRTVYSSLFILRSAGDTEGYLASDSIVTLRHGSFYEFFKAAGQKETGPIHVDPERAEATMVLVLLWYATSKVTKFGRRWLDPDFDIANKKAQMVLNWLLPASRKVRWLAPDDINAHDGHAWAIPVMLNLYGVVAGTVESINDDPSLEFGHGEDDLPSSRILHIAELQQHQKTAAWYARVGEALYLHRHYEEAFIHF